MAERTFPRAADRYEEARREIRRSTEKAKLLDRIAADQHQVARGIAGQSADARRAAQEKVAIEMNKAAEDEGDGMSVEDDEDSDTRLAAVTAIRGAQERLAAMPQQLRDIETAFGERAAAAARLRQLQQQIPAPLFREPKLQWPRLPARLYKSQLCLTTGHCYSGLRFFCKHVPYETRHASAGWHP